MPHPASRAAKRKNHAPPNAAHVKMAARKAASKLGVPKFVVTYA
jgi:hypothetical protein